MWKGNYDLEINVFKHFKNVMVLKSNSYSATVQTKENNKNKDTKTFVVMASYFVKLQSRAESEEEK